EVEHVAAARTDGARDLACVGERVHEGKVLAERMDDLEREPDACRVCLGNESRVRVAEDTRGALPRRALAAAAQYEEHVGAEPVCDVDGAPDAIAPAADRRAVGPELPVRADVRDLQLPAAEQPDRPLGPVRVEPRAGEADRAEAEALEVAHVVLERPP